MAKYKNISGSVLRFDLDFKEKIVDVDGRFTYNGEPNDYITGAVALGTLQLLDEPDAEPAAEAGKPTESPKNTRN